jgi:DNA-binding transcriptional LysR family regulator
MAVVEEGSFTRAAARVHISQSGVSAQIRLLERELGQTLLDRAARTVRPTAAGLAILPSVREALAGVEGARRAADELAGMVRGRVTVGMVTACTVEVLFDALARFHLRYPQIEISLREDSSDRLIDGVRAGVLDLALAGTSQDLPSGVESDVVSDEQLVVAIPAGHPLAERRRIGLEELMDYPLITLPPGAGVRNSFDKACGGRGLTARIGLQASAPDVVAGLAGINFPETSLITGGLSYRGTLSSPRECICRARIFRKPAQRPLQSRFVCNSAPIDHLGWLLSFDARYRRKCAVDILLIRLTWGEVMRDSNLA